MKKEYDARALVAGGQFIAAVMLLRANNNLGLKEAKDICERWEYEAKISPRALEERNTKLRSLLQQMLHVAENADETGYVTDVGFVDLDKLHAEVRAALSDSK